MKSTYQFITFFAVLLFTLQVQSQDKFLLKKTEIVFESKTPLETIKAINNSAQGIIVTGKNKFLIRVPIQAFSFKRRLQQTHFNENYMESSKFPNAVYRGALKGDYDLNKDGTYKVITQGSLEVHGVKKSRTIPATITIKNGVATLKADLMVKPKEHGIKIPKLVTEKIAEEIKVKIKAELKKK